MAATRYLGVDPGIAQTGYALLEGERVLMYGSWRFAPREGSPEERRRAYCEALHRLLRDLHGGPENVVVVLEMQFVDGSMPGAAGQGRAQAALGLALLRGALERTARELGAEVVHVAPQTAKRALTGSGRADKRGMVAMARHRLGLPLRRDEHHVADAAALALAAQARARRLASAPGRLPGWS